MMQYYLPPLAPISSLKNSNVLNLSVLKCVAFGFLLFFCWQTFSHTTKSDFSENKLLVPIDTDADITWALCAEYKIKNNFSLRLGYYRESDELGNLRFFCLGTGFEKNGLRLDFSYLINTSTIQNQLQNSLRLSLGVPLNFEIKQDAEEGIEEAPTEMVSSAN